MSEQQTLFGGPTMREILDASVENGAFPAAVRARSLLDDRLDNNKRAEFIAKLRDQPLETVYRELGILAAASGSYVPSQKMLSAAAELEAKRAAEEEAKRWEEEEAVDDDRRLDELAESLMALPRHMVHRLLRPLIAVYGIPEAP